MFVENAFFINQERILNSERIPDVWIFYLNPVLSLLLSDQMTSLLRLIIEQEQPWLTPFWTLSLPINTCRGKF